MKVSVRALVPLLLWLVFSQPAWAGSHAYDRIVSLSPQVTESIYLLGAEDRIIGVTTFCRRPEAATHKQRIGSPLRPDIEAILGLNPDVVIASREGNPPWAVARLKRLGVRVEYLARPANFRELTENFKEIARLTGTSARAGRIVNEVEAELARTPRPRLGTVGWQVGSDPLIMASTATFANDIIRYAGGTNIITAELPYPRVNVEEVVTRRPAVIVLTDHGYDVDAQERKWRTLLPWVRFARMDPYVIASPNPVTFLAAVRELERTLHE